MKAPTWGAGLGFLSGDDGKLVKVWQGVAPWGQDTGPGPEEPLDMSRVGILYQGEHPPSPSLHSAEPNTAVTCARERECGFSFSLVSHHFPQSSQRGSCLCQERGPS